MSTPIHNDLYAVLGHPIHHSLSPVIHAAFATQTAQQLHYEALDVAPDALNATLQRLPDIGYHGVNITVPHKEAAWAYAKTYGRLSQRAELAGAVNTLAWTTDGLLGDNTDGQGLLNDLQQRHKLNLVGKRILLLGAGGATRGVVLPLLSAQPSALTIANRTANKAEALVAAFMPHRADCELAACALDALTTATRGTAFDLVINATSASLSGEAITLPAGTLSSDGFAYDMMYGKTRTPFLAAQQAAGTKHLADGLGMLVEQAAVAFTLWRGVIPATEPVYNALRAQLAQQT